MIDKDFDPYEELMQLIDFAQAADMHILNLIKNQELLVDRINELSNDVLVLTKVNNELNLAIKEYLENDKKL